MKFVALDRAHHGQRRSRAAAGVFDDAHAFAQRAAPLGAFDHRQRHSIFIGAGRIEVFELDVDVRGVGRNDLAQPQDRRVADGVRTESTGAGEDMGLEISWPPSGRTSDACAQTPCATCAADGGNCHNRRVVGPTGQTREAIHTRHSGTGHFGAENDGHSSDSPSYPSTFCAPGSCRSCERRH